ncbi:MULTISPECIES: phthiocerol/phthiodiolone dimycocerosyl transferase family protein [unclassified Bradyrhizobium]
MQQIITSEPTPLKLSHTARRRFRKASPTETIYLATGTTVVSRSRIAGVVSRAQFEQAVVHLEARYRILRAAVQDGQFIERDDGCPAIDMWATPETCSVDALFATLLNAELDTSKGIYRIHVISAADALDIFMLSSHAVTDATSLVELHSCLAYICDCVVRQVPPVLQEQPFPEPLDAAVERALASLPADAIQKAPSYAGPYTEFPMLAAHDGQALSHRLERIVIAADDVERIHAASHANGCSVHSLLLAAFALAIRDVSEGNYRQILLRSNIDMRRRLEPHVSTELVVTAITGHITRIPDLDQPLFGIARLIFDDIHRGVANGAFFSEYLNYPKSFGAAQQAPVALNVSDMQAVKFRWPMARLRVAGFEYALGWLKKFPNVSVAIYEGTLVANIVYVPEFIDPSVMQVVSEKFVRRLISAAACVAVPAT